MYKIVVKGVGNRYAFTKQDMWVIVQKWQAESSKLREDYHSTVYKLGLKGWVFVFAMADKRYK